jgi:hypothetical protein
VRGALGVDQHLRRPLALDAGEFGEHGHATMRGFVTIQEPAEFQAWMDEQVAAAAATGGEDDIWN